MLDIKSPPLESSRKTTLNLDGLFFLPKALKDKKQFLVWKSERTKKDKKPRKVPYYTNGKRRSGKQGSPPDIAQLSTFEKAVEVAKSGRYDGIGIAILANDGLIGLDFDDCVIDGKINPEISKFIRDTYAEYSPSWGGVRAFYFGTMNSGKNGQAGVEVFGQNGFLTITGNVIAPNEICPIPHDIREQLERITKKARPHGGASGGQSWMNDPVYLHLCEKGAVLKTDDNGKIAISCPFAEQHSMDGGSKECVYWPPNTGGYKRGHFHCFHSHCANRTNDDFLKALGFNQQSKSNFTRVEPDDWPEVHQLPEGMPSVADFEFELLPGSLMPFAADIVERMQCPPEFVGIPIMTILGAVIGRKIGIRPQEMTDWMVIPNQWACLVGRPGVLKSPAMEAAMAPLKRLAAAAMDKYQSEASAYEVAKVRDKLRIEAAEKAARNALKKDPKADVNDLLMIEKEEEPILRRYIANDATAAALGELHRQNPNGLLVFRDELVSLLQSLDREDNAEARGFYLTGWNGDSPYTFDRITRGMNLHISAVCLSVLGSTQPARIERYVNAAVTGKGDDGLLQRFGMLVWPDISGPWKDIDRLPDNQAKRNAFAVFERLADFDPISIGAHFGTGIDGLPEGTPYLRFDADGLGLFRDWRQDLEARLRSGELHPAFESHLSKYRKLVPSLALILHLADNRSGSVGHHAVLQALAWSEYLETHAKRLYASVTAVEISTAKTILKKIKSKSLPTVFSKRDVYRPQWSGLTDREQIKKGLQLLVDYGWLRESLIPTEGRSSEKYELNPKAGLAK